MTWSGGVPPPPGAPVSPAGPPAVEKTGKPVAGGALIIVGAVVGIIMGIFFLIGSALFMPIPIAAGLFAICGAIWLILSIIAMVGGVFAIKRTHFGLAILGGILSLIFGGFIFGLIGLILVALSKKEFT